jgi:hypothetical protein
VPEPSAFEVEMAIEKLKGHKSPGIDQIPAELIKAEGRTTQSEIHKLIISIWNKEELPGERKETITVGSFHQKPTYPQNLDKLHCVENLPIYLSRDETFFLALYLEYLNHIRDIGCSKRTKFSQNKILKITCVSNV